MKLKKLALIFAVLPLLMKYLPALLLSTTMLLPFGCERSNLFQPQTQEPLNNPIHGPSDEIVFALEVIGAQPNTARALSVATNGFVRYRDARYFLGEVTSALSPEELGKHVALFLEKDFLHLGERYESNTALAQKPLSSSVQTRQREKERANRQCERAGERTAITHTLCAADVRSSKERAATRSLGLA